MAVDWTVIITIGISTLTIIIANAGLSVAMFLWLRSEANSERRECTQMIFNLTNTVIAESKEFHSKISALEERHKTK